MTKPIAILTTPRLFAETISPTHFQEIHRLHSDPQVMAKPGIVILHSQADEVVPFVDSEELVRNSGLPDSALIVVGTEHLLADEKSLKAMVGARC